MPERMPRFAVALILIAPLPSYAAERPLVHKATTPAGRAHILA
jgi:hypothetical protein